MTAMDLWISGAHDVFGLRFRDAWSVVGWEEGRVPEGYVCWLQREGEQKAMAPTGNNTPQLSLF